MASRTRCVFASGYNSTNVMDFITIASTGNASDFGDLLAVKYGHTGDSNGHGGIA